MDGLHMTAGQRVLARFADARAKRIGHRGDLFLADHAKVGNDAAKLLIGFAAHLGPPTVSDVEAFVHRHFGGALRVQGETHRMHEHNAAVSLIASMWSERRAYADRRDMIQVGPIQFVERRADGHPKRDAVWEVTRDAEGQPYMKRRTAEDIEAIINERKRRLVGDNRGLCFASVRTAGTLQVGLGDMVRFYADDQTLVGQVIGEQGGGNWEIQTATGKYRVSRQAVFGLVSRADKNGEVDKNRLKDYFSRAYGDDDYADDLVNPR